MKHKRGLSSGRLLRLPMDRLSSTRTPWPAASKASTRCEPMKPAPPVTRISAMTVITIQQARQTGAPGARLDAKGVKKYLAGQYRVLRLVRSIRAGRMRPGPDILDQLAAKAARLPQYRLPAAPRWTGL